MKILIIQEASRHEENKNFRECFCLKRAFEKFGHSAEVWGLGHSNFENKIDYEKYDLIFNLENYDTINWLPDLSKIKTFKVLWSIDAHCRGVYAYDKIFNEGKYNLLLHSTRDYASGKNKIWFPNAYDDSLVYDMNLERDSFIGFCGNYANRKSIIDSLEQEFNIKKDIFVIGNKMVEAINSYQIHFNKNILNDINYRSFETIGASTMLITNYNPQYIKLGFEDSKNCVFYNTKQELFDKLRYLRDNKEVVKQIAREGHELSKKHTYEKRVSSFLKFIGDKV